VNKSLNEHKLINNSCVTVIQINCQQLTLFILLHNSKPTKSSTINIAATYVTVYKENNATNTSRTKIDTQ